MRAILIDPFLQSIRVVEIDGSYESLKTYVFDGKGDGEFLEHVGVGASHGLYIDEEGILKDWDSQKFFRIGNPSGDPGYTLAGRDLMVSDTEEGDVGPCMIPLHTVVDTVTWVDAKDVRVPAIKLTTIDEAGSEKVEYTDCGVNEWHYGRQPYKGTKEANTE